MSQDNLPQSVSVSDDSGNIQVYVDHGGAPRVELGVGLKSALEHMDFVGLTHMLVNRALADFAATKAVQLRHRSAAARALQREARSGPLTAQQRIDQLYQRAVETQRQAQEIRTRSDVPKPTTAGRKSRVWVQAQNGFVQELSVDEQCYQTTPVDSLAAELNQALAEAVMPWVAGGPLMGTPDQTKEG